MIGVVADVLAVHPGRLVVIRAFIALAVLRFIIGNIIVGVAVDIVRRGVIGRVADHALAERVFGDLSVGKEREIIPDIVPVIIGVEYLAVLVADHSDAVAPKLDLYRDAAVLWRSVRPVGLSGDGGEEL